MDGRPKSKAETMKFLGENFMILNLALTSWMVPNAQATEEKRYIKLHQNKNFGPSKSINNQV